MTFRKKDENGFKDKGEVVQTAIIMAGLALSSLMGLGDNATTTMNKIHTTFDCIAHDIGFERGTTTNSTCNGNVEENPDKSTEWKLVYSNDDSASGGKIYVSYLDLSVEEQEEVLNAINNKRVEIMFRDYSEDELMSLTSGEGEAIAKRITNEALNTLLTDNSLTTDQKTRVQLEKECLQFGGIVNNLPNANGSLYDDNKAALECSVNVTL